ncbi:MAG: DUF3854 domain-containing protein [Gordonia sp. (in: high G+C Gram-positive bacteria)]|uniref:DUF3854 domain-containing protein n=1 Tax=Gordonia sp. (in: high G+C Gram-positive bacteria) TaxID=84139 RepID=UPI0039E2DA18
MTLSPQHCAELAESAIPAEVATAAGVHAAYTAAELPSWARWIADRPGALPALVYPMREVDGSPTGQVKPATPIDGAKYLGPSRRSGGAPQLAVVRAVATPRVVLIVEGCKQALAALAWAPADWAIYRITGVYGWKVSAGDGEPGVPTPYLAQVVAGQSVVILGDADATTNIRVFDGLVELGEAATTVGATSVKFVRIPGKRKQGVDDVLAALPSDDERRSSLVGWVADAKATPADLSKTQQKKMRDARLRKDKEKRRLTRLAQTATPGRVELVMQGDYHVDCIAVADRVAATLGKRTLFRRGGRSVELAFDDAGQWTLLELDRDGLHRQALSAVRPLCVTEEGPEVLAGFKQDFLGILKGRLTERLPQVARISQAPVVRPDGTIIATSCYDEATKVLVNLSPDIEGLRVPEHPTDAEIADAKHLLRDVLFERDEACGYDGWVFAREADRTHAVAFLLTMLLRSMFDVVPMILLNGVQRGVGKGELAAVVHRIAYGTEPSVQSMRNSDEEVEKRIASELFAAKSFILLDEVVDEEGRCLLDLRSLHSVLTAGKFAGRLLGKTQSLDLVQQAVWVATGNNIAVPGDIARRLVWIRLSSDRPDLENRDNFRHDLETWVPEHRAELLAAALTLVRAWFDRGQPEAPRPLGFVSFTRWQHVIGGILHLAGIEGFLSTIVEDRKAGDSKIEDNLSHLEWLEKVAATSPCAPRFSAKYVMSCAAADPDREAPYGHDFDDLNSRSLGAVWKRMSGAWFGGLRIVEDGKLHGNIKGWRIERLAPKSAPSSTAPPAGPYAPTPGPRPAVGAAAGETITYTDRRGAAQTVARAMPSIAAGLTIAEMGLIGGDRS